MTQSGCPFGARSEIVSPQGELAFVPANVICNEVSNRIYDHAQQMAIEGKAQSEQQAQWVRPHIHQACRSNPCASLNSLQKRTENNVMNRRKARNTVEASNWKIC
jgi:hypothetical protein